MKSEDREGGDKQWNEQEQHTYQRLQWCLGGCVLCEKRQANLVTWKTQAAIALEFMKAQVTSVQLGRSSW